MKEIVTGIYQIRNIIGGKIYIGSAINLEGRKRGHFSKLINGKHHSCYLQNAYNKYGENSFVFEILEYCEKECLIEREQFYIDALCPEYNIAPKAGSSLGVKYTAEARIKMSMAKIGKKFTDEHRANISAAKIGKKHTAEHCAKISVANIGKTNALGYRHTAEAREKISAANRRRKKKI